MFSKFETPIALRPSDVDYNGHVHHSKYFDLLLAARFQQIEQIYDMPISEYEKHGLGWMVRNYTIEYKRPLKLGDFALVRCWIEGLGDPERGKRSRSLITLNFEIDVSDTGKLAAKGQAVFVQVDTKTGRAVEIPEWVIERHKI